LSGRSSTITNEKGDTFIASLAVRDVTVTYPNGHTALIDATFDLGPGTICGLVGVNGSGKSTLFKAIMGFVKPSAGEVRIGGMPVEHAIKANAIAYVPQSEEVDWNFPVLVEDVVMMGRYAHMGFLRIASSRDHEAVAESLARVGMTEFRKRQIGELSGGQKKRVFLARALAQGARVILLDEPFTGVDVKTETAVIALLRDLKNSGHLMLVSTHDLGSVPDFCDEVVLLNRRVLAAGETAKTFTQKNLERAFGGVLRHLHLPGHRKEQEKEGRAVTVLTDDERPIVFYGEEDAPKEHVPNTDEEKRR
jgi:manganese/iron transport system ATP-binding protein